MYIYICIYIYVYIYAYVYLRYAHLPFSADRGGAHSGLIAKPNTVSSLEISALQSLCSLREDAANVIISSNSICVAMCWSVL